MGKADRRLRKKKERERKVARKKIRERQERLASGKKAELEAFEEALRENLRAVQGTDAGEEGEAESPLELERFRRYLWKAALKAGYDPDHLAEGREAELLEDWETKRRRLLAEDPVEEAHDIMLEAIEESDMADYDDWKSTLRVQQSLIQEALALDPDNIDALTLQGNHAFDLEEDEDTTGFRLLNEAVRKAREALGPGFFAAYRGRIRSRVEAQPFLRALTSLAEHYDGENRLEEAFPVLGELVGYQDEDEAYFHGRYLDAALCLGRWDEVRRLLALPSMKGGPVRPWAECLVEFSRGGPEQALSLLPAALEAAPWFPHTLRDWDEEEPAGEGYSDRDIDRGRAVGLIIGRAWRKAPGARSWLRESLTARDGSKG
jgi:hypothetical protein